MDGWLVVVKCVCGSSKALPISSGSNRSRNKMTTLDVNSKYFYLQNHRRAPLGGIAKSIKQNLSYFALTI